MAQTENPAANGADRDLPTHAVPASELPPSVALHKADMTFLGLLSFSAKSLEIVPFKNASENTAASGADGTDNETMTAAFDRRMCSRTLAKWQATRQLARAREHTMQALRMHDAHAYHKLSAAYAFHKHSLKNRAHGQP
jgi:hypothetical protein